MPPKGSKKNAKADTSTLPPISDLDADQVIARRWNVDLPETADYYFDDEVKDVQKKKG